MTGQASSVGLIIGGDQPSTENQKHYNEQRSH